MPALGELHRVGQQVAQDLRQPLLVGERARPARPARARAGARGPCSSATGRNERSSRVEHRRRPATGAGSTSILPASTFDRSRMSEISVQQVGARAVDRARELDLLARRGCRCGLSASSLRQDQQRVQRRAQLVAHVGQELALVARATARAARRAPRAPRAPRSISAFLTSMSRFCCGRAAPPSPAAPRWSGAAPPAGSAAAPRRRAATSPAPRARVGALELLLLGLQLLGLRLQLLAARCSSSSSVRLLAMIVDRTTPIVSDELLEERQVDLGERVAATRAR